ncbi:hypothetical protein JCM10212_004586 [Sporobolomyces blumeae]
MADAFDPSTFQATYVQALYAYTGSDSSSLSFRQGDIIEVLSTLESGWWDGIHCDSRVRGWFPSNYVQHVSEDDALWAREQNMEWWDVDRGGGGDRGTALGQMRRGSVESTLSQGEERLAREFSQANLGPGQGGGGASSSASMSRSGSTSSAVSRSGGGTGTADGQTWSRDVSLQDFLSAQDLTSFSNGGDIFGEIAAAAAQNDSRPGSRTGSLSSRRRMSDYSTAHSYSATSTDPQGGGGGGGGGGRRRDGSGAAEEDYWVPKMTIHGQLFYFNTRTGETSMDMPIDGQGDGVFVDPREFGVDEHANGTTPNGAARARAGTDDEWSERRTADGQGTYYVNLRTGEQSWDGPTSVLTSSTSIAASSTSAAANGGLADASTGTEQLRPVSVADNASLFSAFTARPTFAHADDSTPRRNHGKDRGSDRDSQRARSVCSDDSALDTAFAGHASRERKASVDPGGGGRGGGGGGGDRKGSTADSFQGSRASTSRKPAAAAELLGPPPPPLISDLEEVVTRALQELISAVGVGGAVRRASVDATTAAREERDRLAVLGDNVVNAVRLVLHSSGVLEQPVLASIASSTTSVTNEIQGPFTYSTPLPPTALAQLRPSTRRLVSTLSKLTFSLRAIWGLLETTPEDQALEEDDSPADPEETLRRAQIRQQISHERRAVAASRFEHETKLRSEIMSGAKDVSEHLATFLEQFQVVLATLSSQNGGPRLPLDLLRAPKAAQGSLRTNAAALLLPGGGYGGNWRGNGFVSLPTPHTSPLIGRSGTGSEAGLEGFARSGRKGPETLSYAWPDRPFDKAAVEDLSKWSSAVLDQAVALQAKLTADSRPSDDVFERATAILSPLGSFLTRVEEFDIAAVVDFQTLRNGQLVSRSPSTSDGLANDDANQTISLAYRQSVVEAKPLLAELETRKQALYDAAPRLLTALQSLFLSSPPTNTDAMTFPSAASQPIANAPLSTYSVPTPFDPATSPLDVVNDLISAVPALCSTLSSLAAIAETQSSAPRPGGFRGTALPFRASAFGVNSGEGEGESAPTGSTSEYNREVSSMVYGVAGSGAAGSGAGSRQSHDSSAMASFSSRDSVDSDSFFSGPLAGQRSFGSTSQAPSQHQFSPATTSSSSLPSVPPSRQQGSIGGRGSVSSAGQDTLSSSGVGLPPGWDRRRGSVATTTSSAAAGDTMRSSGLTPLAEIAQTSALSPTRTSAKRLNKLLGDGVPVDAAYEPAKPWYLERDYGDDELSFTTENTIKGGTLRGLIIAATSHEGRVDSSYLSAFLMTYRTFCTGSQLLDQLIERYLMPSPPGLVDEKDLHEWESQKLRPIRARVANLLKAWVREYMDHEEMNRDLLLRIREFAMETMLEKGQSLQICKSVDERMQGVGPRAVGNLAPGPLPPPIIPRNLKKIKFIDIEPLELARQLTIMDGRLFQRITPQECLGKAWPKEFGSEAPNISAMIDMSNAITRWVTETILAQDDQKKRAAIVKHFVAIAERCLSLNNFSTLIHIIAGLNSTPIHRLRRTWEAVSQKSMVSLGVLNNIMRPDKNYKEYRDVLRKAAPPCVPFLGVYLTDWTFIGDGNPDTLREKPHQINFHKRQKASELILMIKLHQATTYNLSAVPPLANFLQEQLFPKGADPANDDQRLYEVSLQREPRERDDERIARLLGESGFL